MRDSLTVLAILLIGVLTAALVGPYLVDWDSHRALIEARLSAAAGAPVAVTGPIDVKLLPKPVLRLGGVTVGGGGRPRLSARSLDAELSLAGLLRGQVQVVDTVLVGPRLDLVQGLDGGFGLPLPAEDAADRVAVDHLGLRDATLAVTLADGRRATLAGIDLDGEAASLRGPFKAAGRVGAVPFRLGTGALEGGRLRVKLHLDGAGARPSLDLDGTASARPGALGPGFDGTAAAAGAVELEGTPAAVPWRAAGRLSADRDGARAADVELRAGADLRALIASGDGDAAYAGAEPRASLRLHGAVLDADALAVPPADSSVAPPKGFDIARLLLRAAGGLPGRVPLRLDLGAAFDTATLAGRTALGTSATLGLGPEPGAALALSVDGPDGARLALDGRVEPGSTPPVAGPFGAGPATAAAFRGRAAFRSPDLRRTAAWLRPAAPGLADWLAAAVPGRSVEAGGAVTASADGVGARDLALRVDGSAFAGAASFAPAAGGGRPRLTVDLASDALDLDRVPDLSGTAAAWRGLDLDLSLAARAVTLAASPAGPVTAGHVALRFTAAGDAVRLERLALDLGGARLDASGSRDAAGARGEVRVSAPQLAPLADALAPLLPAPAAAALRARAGPLSPMEATVSAEAVAEPDGGLAPTRFAFAGTVGGARLDAALAPDGPAAGLDAAHRPAALTLRAESADGADLLRILGFAAPGPVAGAARLSAEARGTLADGMAGTLDAALGPAALSWSGRAGPGGGAGRLSASAADLRPAMAAAGLPVPAAALPGEAAGDLAWDAAALRWRGLSARVGGAAVAGELSLDLAQPRGPAGEPLPALHGRLAVDRLPAEALLGLALGPGAAPAPGAAWSAQPFGPPPAGLPRGEVALSVGAMPLRGALDARAVSLALRTAPDAVALGDVAGEVGGGAFAGALALRRDGPNAVLSGRVTLQGVALDAGGLAGRLGGAEDVVASGTSPAALAASLSGTGTLSLSGASLARTDPGAPARVLAAATARDALAERGSSAAAPTPPDAATLRRDLAAALDAGPLPIGTAAAPAALAGGVLRAGPLRLAAPAGQGAPADASVAFDLRSLTLTTRAALGGPAGGAVVTRTGPLGGEATRELDVAGLVEAVQSRAIARAQDRIDVMEQDIRERAAFNRQLKAIVQRQQAEREQAEAARRAEAVRALAEAQAQAEAARAAAEAKRVAAEAARTAAEEVRAAAARQKAEDARVQAQVESAARAERDEAEKRRFIERALRDTAPADAAAPLDRLRARPARPGRDPLDPPPPPSIVQERGAEP